MDAELVRGGGNEKTAGKETERFALFCGTVCVSNLCFPSSGGVLW